MRVRRLTLWLSMSVLLAGAPAVAQQHILDSSTMQQAVASARSRDDANRDAVRRVLSRDDVTRVAEMLGLDVKQAQTALATMTSSELEELAVPARNLERDLAGGSTTVAVALSLTSLLLALILIGVIAS